MAMNVFPAMIVKLLSCGNIIGETIAYPTANVSIDCAAFRR
jgi:hypothetical protein